MKTVFFICLIACAQAVPSPVKRIANGGPAALFSSPYQVSLNYWTNDGYWLHICGGALIQNNKVLTAAHCVINKNPERLRVLAGVLNLGRAPNNYKQTIGLSSFVTHEGYTGTFPGLANDIAIITLKENVTFNNKVKLAMLAVVDSPFATMKCNIAGWGQTSKSPPKTPQRLQTVDITEISTAECQSRWPAQNITSKHVCLYENSAPYGTRPSACMGDGGGPMMCGDPMTCGDHCTVVVGITSWGSPSCDGGKPAVYTRVAAFLDWITQHV